MTTEELHSLIREYIVFVKRGPSLAVLPEAEADAAFNQGVALFDRIQAELVKTDTVFALAMKAAKVATGIHRQRETSRWVLARLFEVVGDPEFKA